MKNLDFIDKLEDIKIQVYTMGRLISTHMYEQNKTDKVPFGIELLLECILHQLDQLGEIKEA